MITLKVAKKQGLTLSLEDTVDSCVYKSMQLGKGGGYLSTFLFFR